FIIVLRVNKVIKKYGRNKIAKYFPTFWDTYPLVIDAQAIVAGSREDRAARKAAYKKLAEDYLPKMMGLYNTLIQIKELDIPDTAEELGRVKTVVAINNIVVFLGALFSIFAFILTWLAWAYPSSYWQ